MMKMMMMMMMISLKVLSLFQVPYTCCVLNNTDPDNPEPQNKAECQSEARNNPSSFQFLHNEVLIIHFLFWHSTDKKHLENYQHLRLYTVCLFGSTSHKLLKSVDDKHLKEQPVTLAHENL